MEEKKKKITFIRTVFDKKDTQKEANKFFGHKVGVFGEDVKIEYTFEENCGVGIRITRKIKGQQDNVAQAYWDELDDWITSLHFE